MMITAAKDMNRAAVEQMYPAARGGALSTAIRLPLAERQISDLTTGEDE
jgi:hypothetical protein